MQVPVEESVPVLLIGFAGNSRRALRDILESGSWEVREAATYAQAARMLNGREMAVTICNTMIGDNRWQALLRDLEGTANPPHLVVTARLADERLWAEVLNLGGYDVLAQPFDRDEVLRVIETACVSWQQRRFTRSLPRIMTAGS